VKSEDLTPQPSPFVIASGVKQSPAQGVIASGAKQSHIDQIPYSSTGEPTRTIPSPLRGETPIKIPSPLMGEGKGEGGISIHPTASVSDRAHIGKGTKIWHNSQIQSGAQIGENCTIGHNCFIGSRAKLGNGVKLESNIDVWDLITVEDYVFVGPSAVFTNDINPRAKYPKKKYPQFGKWIPTLVKEGASIGANATIICGITIANMR